MISKLWNRRKRALSLVLTVVMTLSMMTGLSVTQVYGEASSVDVTEILENVNVNVKQGDEILSESDVIDPNENIKFDFSFDVPVAGDDPTPNNIVKSGDIAKFDLPDNLEYVTPDTAIDLKLGTDTVGVLTFDGKTAQVTFSDLLDEDGVHSVSVAFSIEMLYMIDYDNYTAGDYDVEILEKTYKLTLPERVIEISGDKEGQIIGDSVRWHVVVNGSYTDNNADAPLGGYTFLDDLTSVGAYVADSLSVGTSSDYTSATPVDSADYTYNDDTLTYAFPQDASGSRHIFFETKISDDVIYDSGATTIDNTAIIENEMDQEVGNYPGSVTYKPEWIDKEGKVVAGTEGSEDTYSTTGRQIEWTIEVNQNGLPLSNVVITDVLPDGLTFESAKYKTNDETTWTDITPNNSDYSIGNITTMASLVIVANVDDTSEPTGVTTYTNTASVTWGKPGGGTGSASSQGIGVGIGFNPITKSSDGYDPSSHEVDWSVTVNTKNLTYGGDLRVLDLLVYGDSFDINDINTITNNSAGNLSDINTTSIEKLTPKFNQKVVEGSITSDAGLKVTLHTLKDGDGKAIADVLVLTDENGNGLDHTSTHNMAFKTLITNPDIYSSNETTTVENVASLFSSDTSKANASASKNVKSNMLNKDMLTRSNAAAFESDITDLASLNGDAANDSSGFDYNDKSVIFRIHVNANGLTDAVNDVTGVDGVSLGNLVVKDQLPEGWAFQPIDGQDYLLFEGELKSAGVLNATTRVLDDSGILVSGGQITNDSSEISFEFQALTKPYVIVVKAGPTQETIEEYFDGNKTVEPGNNVTLTNDAHITVPVDDSQTVKVVSKVIDKSADTSKATSDGYITWEIVYKPYDLEHEGAYIEDTLPIGLDLPTDASGQLDLDGNITLTELKVEADGSVSDLVDIDLDNTDLISYDLATRVLKLDLPDTSKAYRLTYLTDITGEPGNVTNSVKLYTFNETGNTTSASYAISELAYSASFDRSGWVKVNKEDKDGGAIAGVEFTLYAEDETTIIRQAVTNSEGVAYLKVLPEGNFILKETEAAASYLISEGIYHVAVEKIDNNYTTTVDGGTNNITVVNHLVGTSGSLVIEKSVAGNGGDLNKSFDFKVIFEEDTNTYNYFGTGLPNGTITSGDTIALAHGQSITIVGIPKDTAYTVTETDYSNEGYVTVSSGDVGTILVDDTVTASFTNTRNVGNLIIEKDVAGNGADESDKFDFIVTLEGTNLTYNYIGTGVADGTITSGDTISLAHNERIEIIDLPAGTAYSVIEKPFAADEGYVSAAIDDTGIISTVTDMEALFINSKHVGSLQVKKTVEGNRGSFDKTFDFTVTFGEADRSFDYVGVGIEGGTITSGDTIALAHGQSFVVIGLPEDMSYTVEEADYSDDGYSTVKAGDVGTILVDEIVTASFTNTKNAGNLIIGKKVAGKDADETKKFDFTVTFDGTNLTYNYIGTGVDDGTITSGDTISLAHNELIEIIDLPAGLAYSVVEASYEEAGYNSSVVNGTGLINTTGASEALFINTKKVGSLQISKTVSGNRASTTKAFDFTVTFGETDPVYDFVGIGREDGTITSGDTIQLTHGQSITIIGLPADMTYTVEEADYASDGYTTTITGDATGVIEEDILKEVAFRNRKHVSTSTDTDDEEEVTEPDPVPEEETTAPEPEEETSTPEEDKPIIEKVTPTTPDEDITYKPTEEVEDVVVKVPPTKGTVEIEEDGTIIYIPGPGFDGTDKIVVIVTTPDGEEEEFEIDIFEDIPEAGLPQTGGLPMNVYMILGGAMVAAGFKFKGIGKSKK